MKNKNFEYWRSLRVAALLPLLLLLLMALTLAGYSAWLNVKLTKEHSVTRAQQIIAQTRLLNLQSKSRAENNSFNLNLQRYLEELASQKTDVTVKIVDANEAVLFEYVSGMRPHSAGYAASAPLDSADPASANIQVMVAYSQQPSLLISRLVIAVLALLAFAFLARQFFLYRHKIMLGKIDAITDIFRDYENSDFSTILPDGGPIEMYKLQQSINHLTHYLKKSKTRLDQQVSTTTEELNQTLEEVEIKNVELDLARKRAVESNEAKSTFLANISHEIRSPMNGVIGHLQLLQRLPSSAQQSAYIDNTLIAANALLDIIDDTLNLSRIEANKLDIQTLPFNLLDELNRCVVMLAPAALEKQLNFYFLSAPNLPDIFYGDSLRVRQVITNLISNAIKYTPGGSVSVGISAQPRNAKKYDVTLSVSDTGLGMDSAQIDSLFEAYSQAGRSPESGTGLGLVITRSLTEAMGGKLELVSEINKGSVFSVRLVLAARDQDKVPQKTRHKSATGFVDCEDAVARDNYEQILTHAGMRLIRENTDQADVGIIVLTSGQIQQYELQNVDIVEKYSAVPHPLILLVSSYKPNLINQLNATNNCTALPLYSHARTIGATLQRLLDPARESASPQISPTTSVTAPAGDQDENPHDKMQHLQGFRVLLADDDKFGRAYMSDLLSQHGMVVDSCANGQQAIEHTKSTHYDLILMDIRMPVCNGIEATRQIRSLAHTQLTPIIGMTASMVPEQHQQCVHAGMNDYWVKPLQISQLISGLEHWLHRGHEDTVTGVNAVAKPSDEVQQSENDNLAEFINALDDDMRVLLLAELNRYQNEFTDQSALDIDISDLYEAAHRLNGCAAICRFMQLQKTAGQVETCARLGDRENLTVAMQALAVEISRIRNLLERRAMAQAR